MTESDRSPDRREASLHRIQASYRTPPAFQSARRGNRSPVPVLARRTFRESHLIRFCPPGFPAIHAAPDGGTVLPERRARLRTTATLRRRRDGERLDRKSVV